MGLILIHFQIEKRTPRDDEETLSREVDRSDTPTHRRIFSEEEKAFLEKRKRLRKDQREGKNCLTKKITCFVSGKLY